jgi:sugar phosphate isomerase/epimerase
MNTVFVSTGGIREKSAIDTARSLFKQGISAVELSGGAFLENQIDEILLLKNDITFQVHNYFPPPRQPFVFNLASSDPVLLQQSIEHVRSAVRLSAAVGRPVYSFHAGFRINPKVSELGQSLGNSTLRDRNSSLQEFGESVLLLAEEARSEGVTLLIENNVLNIRNFYTFGEDPLLLANPDEIRTFMNEMPVNVGLLLDVAHLKVSGVTLGFNLINAHKMLMPWIRGYHLSDNDGTDDSNQIVTKDSWFWEVIKPGLDYYSLEVYNVPFQELVTQYELVKIQLSNKKGMV